MKTGGWLVLLGLSLSTAASAESLQVITFNLGLAQVGGNTVLPSRDRRLISQVTSITEPAFPISTSIYLAAGGTDTVPCRKERLEAQIAEIPRAVRPPFVLLLQEALGSDAEEKFRNLAQEKGWYVTTSPTWGRGLMILSSEAIGGEVFIPFSRDNFLMRRGVLKAEINIEGKLISILNTHTAFSGPKGLDPSHVAQVKEIAAEAKEAIGPTILGGDFNLGEGLIYGTGKKGKMAEEKEKEVEEMWHRFLGYLKSAWFETQLPEGEYTRDTKNPLLVKPASIIRIFGGWKTNSNASIDHIFVSRGLEKGARKAQLVFDQLESLSGCRDNQPVPLSDHFGVETEIELNSVSSVASAN